MSLPLQPQPLRSNSKPNQVKISRQGQPRLFWSLGGLALILFVAIFGTVLALHLLTLPARRVPSTLTTLVQPEQAQAGFVPGVGSVINAKPTSIPKSTTGTGLLVPIGEMGQSIVQGEFGLLVDKIELITPATASEGVLPAQLLTVHVHLTNFQGSYYKVRSLVGSTFLLKPGSTSASIPTISSLSPTAALTRHPGLDLTRKTNLQFGDAVSGWLTFQLPNESKATPLELQFVPANNSAPIRVRLVLPT